MKKTADALFSILLKGKCGVNEVCDEQVSKVIWNLIVFCAKWCFQVQTRSLFGRFVLGLQLKNSLFVLATCLAAGF